MFSFKTFLTEIYGRPNGMAKFQSSTNHIRDVDVRDNNWMTTVDSLMLSHNFRAIGAGKYASVYSNPSYPYVIKVFMKDTAYLKWLNFAKQNQNNSYVPKIRGKVIKINHMFMAVRLEKLVPSIHVNNTNSEKMMYDAADRGDKDAQDVLRFLEANDKLLDLHIQNIMARPNGDIVVIDPFYNWFKGGFTIDPNDISAFKALF